MAQDVHGAPSDDAAAAEPQKPPTIIGIFGVSGCGKEYLHHVLDYYMIPYKDFAFFKRSTVIESIFPGGIVAYKAANDATKARYWKEVAPLVRDSCREPDTVGVVAGHYLFWDDELQSAGSKAWTDRDAHVYTHIIYLQVEPRQIVQQRLNDTSRRQCSEAHVARWQEREISELQEVCEKTGILFNVVQRADDLAEFIPRVIGNHFRLRSAASNNKAIGEHVENRISSEVDTVLVIDGDKTLIAEDSNKVASESNDPKPSPHEPDPLQTYFKGKMPDSWKKFVEVLCLFRDGEGQNSDHSRKAICRRLTIRPAFQTMLETAAKLPHVHVIVITSGVGMVFEELLIGNNLLSGVTVIGWDKPHTHFVTAETKKAVVDHLRTKVNKFVYAFGDCPLDIQMLKAANRAIVVVGDEISRSKSTDECLETAITNEGLVASQTLFPESVPQRLDDARLPTVSFDAEFINSVLRRHAKVTHATQHRGAKILQTATCNAQITDPALQAAHTAIGKYLALQYIVDFIGIEPYDMSHAQPGNITEGYRLRCEQNTLIVSLPGGGESMAVGVSETFPLAMIVHAKQPSDLKGKHLRRKRSIVLVDSVINNDTSMLEFLQRIRNLNKDVQIVIVAGVVQEEAVKQTIQDGGNEVVDDQSRFADVLFSDPNINLVALQLSEDKYEDQGGSDTVHRLSNTAKLKRFVEGIFCRGR